MADEEQKESLPVGDPEAGYLAPAPAEGFATGTLPPEEQDALDARAKEHEEQSKAIAEHEDEVAKARAKATETTPESTPKTPKTSSSASGS